MDGEVARAEQLAVEESVSVLVAALHKHCDKSGDWSAIQRLLLDYEQRLANLQDDNIARITALLQAEVAEKLLKQERNKSTELRRQLEALKFRTAHNITCKLTEDTVPDNPELSIEHQAQVIMRSFELGDIPTRPVETDRMTRAEAVLALHNQFTALRQVTKQIRSVLKEQVIERLHLRRAIDEIHSATTDMEQQLDDARRGVQLERDARMTITTQLKAEIKEAKDRTAKLEHRLFVEIEAARKTAREREEKLENQNNKLAEEVERLRTVEKRLIRTESDLEAARATAQELRTARAADVKRAAEASNVVRLSVLEQLQKFATAFDTLPLPMKLEQLVSREPASSKLARDDLLVTAAGTEALTQDLKEHFQALNSATGFMAKLLHDSNADEIQKRVDDERHRLRELSDLRKKINEQLLRVDPEEFGADVSKAVDEHITLEKSLKKLRTDVRRSMLLSPELAQAMSAVEAEIDEVERESYRRGDGSTMMMASGDEDREMLHQRLITELLMRADPDGHSAYDSLTPEERQLIPELQGALSERQLELLVQRSVQSRALSAGSTEGNSGGETCPTGGAPSSTSTARNSVAALLSSLSEFKRAQALPLPSSQAASAAAATTVSPNSSVARSLPPGHRQQPTFGAILPPLRNIKNETAQSASTLFGRASTYTAEMSVAHVPDVAQLLQGADEERIQNLRSCLSILENAQKEYLKSKGVRLPPLDACEIDPDSEIGAPFVRGAGGLMSGKRWRSQWAVQDAQAREAAKSKPKLAIKGAKKKKS